MENNETTEEVKVTPLTVQHAQNAPAVIPTGYAYSEVVYTTSS